MEIMKNKENNNKTKKHDVKQIYNAKQNLSFGPRWKWKPF